MPFWKPGLLAGYTDHAYAQKNFMHHQTAKFLLCTLWHVLKASITERRLLHHE